MSWPGVVQRASAVRGELGRAGEDDLHRRRGQRRRRGDSRGATSRRALLLLQLGRDALLLEPRQVFDEDLAFEVIDLVLYTYCQQAFGFQRERLAVRHSSARTFTRSARRTLSNTPGTERQPSSVSASPLGFDDFRVHEGLELVASFRDIDDDDALVHIDLRRGEADARRGIHRLSHVLD